MREFPLAVQVRELPQALGMGSRPRSDGGSAAAGVSSNVPMSAEYSMSGMSSSLMLLQGRGGPT